MKPALTITYSKQRISNRVNYAYYNVLYICDMLMNPMREKPWWPNDSSYVLWAQTPASKAGGNSQIYFHTSTSTRIQHCRVYRNWLSYFVVCQTSPSCIFLCLQGINIFIFFLCVILKNSYLQVGG